MISKHILMITFLNEPEHIFLHKGKWFHFFFVEYEWFYLLLIICLHAVKYFLALLFSTNNSIE